MELQAGTHRMHALWELKRREMENQGLEVEEWSALLPKKVRWDARLRMSMTHLPSNPKKKKRRWISSPENEWQPSAKRKRPAESAGKEARASAGPPSTAPGNGKGGIDLLRKHPRNG
ncbi:hypothetical protein BDZ91DRAFT_738441 [Kalaharituber pfeilii]|nr:hypothetical protein BDZ91DRAFT_738441 [Kalaharituber pfeilii]